MMLRSTPFASRARIAGHSAAEWNALAVPGRGVRGDLFRLVPGRFSSRKDGDEGDARGQQGTGEWTRESGERVYASSSVTQTELRTPLPWETHNYAFVQHDKGSAGAVLATTGSRSRRERRRRRHVPRPPPRAIFALHMPRLALFVAALPLCAAFVAVPRQGLMRSGLALRAKDAVEGTTVEPDRPLDMPPVGPHTEGFLCLGVADEVTPEELSNENMIRIVRQESSDEDVNRLVWRCLGYRGQVAEDGAVSWDAEKCFPKWKTRFPTPPDVIGMKRIYTPDVDKDVMEANRALVRTIPMAHKQSLKTHLKPAGFPGFKLKELTPNKTRRAQAANWLLFFREELYGKSIEELVQKREAERAAEAEQKAASEDDGEPPAFTPPINEVF